jgi:hypothetical protein
MLQLFVEDMTLAEVVQLVGERTSFVDIVRSVVLGEVHCFSALEVYMLVLVVHHELQWWKDTGIEFERAVLVESLDLAGLGQLEGPRPIRSCNYSRRICVISYGKLQGLVMSS